MHANIEVRDPSLLTTSDWRELRDRNPSGDAPSVDDFKRYLAEEHHRWYGRPWCIGRSYFDFLLGRGLERGHRVLDFGCGAGRLGIWLIGHLEAGQYNGVDHHWS